MRIRNPYLLFVVLLFAVAQAGIAQTPATPEVGAYPYKSYSGGDIDHIQMQNGSLYLRIPILSYPQLGKLKLSFSLLANSPQFQFPIYCDPSGDCLEGAIFAGPEETCAADGSSGGNVSGPNNTAGNDGQSNAWLVVDQDFAIASCYQMPVEVGPTYNYVLDVYTATAYNFYTIYGLVDSSGAQHTLGFNPANWSSMQTTDGSGFTVQMPWANTLTAAQNASAEDLEVPCPASFTITDSSGVKQTTSCGPLGGSEYLGVGPTTISDPAGNTIQRTTPGANPVTITDSVGRQIPDPALIPTANASWFVSQPGIALDANPSAVCPNLSIPGEPVSYSVSWTVPGYLGASSTYHFCYSTVHVGTNFFGDGVGAGPPGSCNITSEGSDEYGDAYNTWYCYQDMMGTEQVLQSVVLPNNTYWGFVYDTALTNTQVSYGDLLQVILPSGGSLNYTYTSVPLCGPDIGDEIIPVGRAVASRTLNPLVGNPVTTTYAYLQSTSGRPNPLTIETDGSGNDTVHTFTLGGGFCGYEETSTKWYQGSSDGGISGTVLKEVDTSYTSELNPQDDVSDGSRGIVNILPHTQTTYLNGQAASSESYGYDTLFTASETYELGEMPTTSPIRYDTPTYSDDGIKRTTTVRQATFNSAYQTAGMLALPESVVETDENGVYQAETIYGYDEAGSPQGLYGNLTSVTKDYGVKTTKQYNSHAMPTQITDADGNSGIANHTTYFNYDTQYGLYVTSVQAPVTNGVPHVRYYQQDPNTGWTTAISDENASSINDTSHTSYYSYDAVGRLIRANYPDGGQVTQCYTDEGGVSGVSTCSLGSAPFSLFSERKQSSNLTQSSSAGFDGLGRVIETQSPAGAIVNTTYDVNGQVEGVTNPFYSGSSPSGTTSYQYDALGRKTALCQPDNLPINATTCVASNSYETWGYNGNLTTFTDENGHAWQRTTDAHNRLVKVIEPGGLTALYGYNALDDLLAVNQLGNSSSDNPRNRSFTYDALSRLVCASNPENAVSACPSSYSGSYTSGTTGYTYDANGNVLTRTDARGVATTYSYDALNRIVSKTYSDHVTPLACYQYDSSSVANGIGRLTNAWTLSASSGVSCPTTTPFLTKRSLAYDAMGRILNEQQFTPASHVSGYAPAYTYDLAGNLLTSTSGVAPTPTVSPILLTNTYDGAGRLQTVTSNVTSNWINGTVLPPTLFAPPPTQNTSCTSQTGQYAPFGGLMNASFGIGSTNTPAFTLNRNYDNRLRTICENDMGASTTPTTPGSATVTITGAEQTH